MKFFLPKMLIVAISLSVAFSSYAQERGESVLDTQKTADALSKKAYVIFISDDAIIPYGSSPINPLIIDGLDERQKPEMRRLAVSMSEHYGFTPINVTSWIGYTISASLDDSQVQALREDPRVENISEGSNWPINNESNEIKLAEDNAFVSKAGSTPLWSDDITNYGITSWGVKAMGGSKSASFYPNSNVPIYLIDEGAGLHSELQTITGREGPNVPIGGIQNANFVGCYSHTTGLAGIISATADTFYPNPNSTVSHGLYEGAPIVSISIEKAYDPTNGNCLKVYKDYGGDVMTLFLGGLDEAKRQITFSGKMGIVNISMNGSMFANANVRDKIRGLANPSGSYKGAFVVQSAGNQGGNACDNSYASNNGAADTNDGVMIVGAFDEYGNRAVNLNANVSGATTEAGSNYGNCVDVWAPGKRIYMPWGGDSFNAKQNASTTYNNHIYLDGSSFAAPFVAAAASYVTAVYNLTTPQAVEQKLRSLFKYIGKNDRQESMYAIDLNTTAPATVITWLIDGKNVNGETLSKQTGQPFTFEFRATTASRCDLTAYYNNAYWFTATFTASIGGIPTGYNWGLSRLTENKHENITLRYEVTCANGSTSVKEIVTLVETPPIATWTDGFYSLPRNYIRYVYNQPYALGFMGYNVNSCNLTVYGGVDGTTFWYSADNSIVGTSYYWSASNMWDWGPGYLTKWVVTCSNAYGYSDTNWTAVQK